MLLDTWHKRVGAILLLLREQEKAWDRMTAAQESKVDAKTIKRIERGSETVTGAKLRQYARVFGLTFEEVSERATHLEASGGHQPQTRDPRNPSDAEIVDWVLLWVPQQSAAVQDRVRDGLPQKIREKLEPQPPQASVRPASRRRGARGA